MHGAIHLFKSDDDLRSFRTGEKIFQEGESAECMYIVREGEVEIYAGGRLLETVGVSGIFGELSLIDRDARSATAVATADCLLVPIDQRRFIYLVQESPMFALQVMGVMASRLRRMTTP